jgi:predicted NUDIX family NTP pyrophosphohydrolase
MFELLGNYKKEGGDVVINWYHEADDTNMLDDVEDLQIESGIKINLIPIE